MKKSIYGLVLGLVAMANVVQAGVMVSAPSNLNDYIAVQFVPGEDSPTIKANGLTTINGYVWVEKSSPVFETWFSEYDYPYVMHDLSSFTSLSSGLIEVGMGNAMREVNYFNSGWNFYPWSTTSSLGVVPEPSSIALGLLSMAGLTMMRRHS